MKVKYIPQIGLKIGEVEIKWGTPRFEVRLMLGLVFEEDNDEAILLRRDIYMSVNGSRDSFFIGYDKYNLLSEFEVHYADSISIDGLCDIRFDESIVLTLDRLKRISPICIELEEGSYLFKDLYCCVADADSMGGEGDKLRYFYTANDISHLLD